MRPTPIVPMIFLLAACGTGPLADHSVRDSAGVRIVENRSPAGPTLRLDSIPSIDIGPGASPATEFISPISAVRQPDGRIVAAGWAMTELQLFDSTGRWLKTVGRRGAGPGEFEALGFIFQTSRGDLVTFEPGTQRVQRWTRSADFISLNLLTSPNGRPTASVIGIFEDQSLLLSLRAPDEAEGTALTSRERNSLFRAPPDGGAWDSLTTYLGRPSIRHPQNPAWSWGAPLWSSGPHTRQGGQRIAFAPGDRFEIQIRDPQWRLQQIIRRTAEPRQITDAEFERALAATVEATRADLREAMRERYRQTSTNRVRPPIYGIHLAGDGRVWAMFGDSTLGERPSASVFDSLGRWEADVELPVGFRILQVATDGLLGMSRDADGFYHLRFYRLWRGEA